MERRIDEKENEWTNEQNFYKEVNHELWLKWFVKWEYSFIS
jgi:hypothetical protein